MVTIDSKTGGYKREVEYYSFAHASKFVRPGAYRIASDGNDSTLTNVAFQNPDNGSVVLIVLNSAAASRAFAIRWGDTSFSYTLPPIAVATFVWK